MSERGVENMENIIIEGALEYYKMGYILLCEDGKVVEINNEEID